MCVLCFCFCFFPPPPVFVCFASLCFPLLSFAFLCFPLLSFALLCFALLCFALCCLVLPICLLRACLLVSFWFVFLLVWLFVCFFMCLFRPCHKIRTVCSIELRRISCEQILEGTNKCLLIRCRCGSKPMVPFWGRCTTHFTILVGIGMLTGGGILTHGHVARPWLSIADWQGWCRIAAVLYVLLAAFGNANFLAGYTQNGYEFQQGTTSQVFGGHESPPK